MLTSPNAYAAFVVGSAAGPEAAYQAVITAPAVHSGVQPSFWLEVLALLADDRATEDQTLDLAEAFFDREARRQFEADGSVDRGTCGGVMLGYRANTRFAKAMVARGIGRKMGGRVYLTRRLPDDVRTQHMTVDEKAHDAFAAVAAAAGHAAAEHRSYVD
jgi:hypothetical protein